jgi:biotin transport system substrate-specific component
MSTEKKIWFTKEENTMTKHIPARELVLTALFAALTAVGAFIKVPTPWSAFTLQVLFVFMAGALLGPKYGMLAQVVYVVLGLVGLPIFTGGGGFTYVLKPTFGFLLSYIPTAWVVGWLIRRWGADFWHIVLACLVGLAVIYAIGLPYMGLILNLYMGQAMGVKAILWSGMIIFLPYDFLKIAVTALLAKPLIPALERIKASHN